MAPTNDTDVEVTLRGGRVLECTSAADPIKGLRTRADFITPASRKAIDALVQRKSEIPFMPTDVQTTHEQGAYRIQLFGVMMTGEKACVVLENVPVYFDVWAPREWYADAAASAAAAAATAAAATAATEAASGSPANNADAAGAPDASPPPPSNGEDYLVPAPPAAVADAHQRLESAVCKALAGINLAAEKYERGLAYKPVGVQLAKSPHLRVFFSSTHDRERAIKEVAAAGFATASDDPGRRYHWQVARHLNIDFTQWAVLKKHKGGRAAAGASAGDVPGARPGPSSSNLTSSHGRGSAGAVKCRAFRVDIAHYAMYPGDPLATPLLARDRTLVATWDIEALNAGTIDPRRPDDDIFLAALTFHWKDDPAPLHSVVVSTIDLPADPRWDAVICADERALIVALARVFAAFQPEYFTGFNDGGYDWPYYLIRAQRHRVLGLVESLFSVHDWKPKTDYEVASRGVYGNLSECLLPDRGFGCETTGRPIKVPENTARVVYLQTPGCLWYDSKIELWQRHGNKTTNKKLNTYLAANGVASKTGLSIKEMFRRAREYRAAVADAAALRRDRDAIDAPPAATPAGARARAQLEAAYARVAAAVESNRAIAKYCWWDAASLQAVQVKRSFIADAREVAAMAHVTVADYFFLANGAKVRNMAFAWAERYRDTLFSARVSVPTYAGKFPGAHVFYPQKGVHRDRPITGLDFSSLYPSIMMAYNLSLEKITRDPAVAAWLRAAGHALHPIEFDFLGKPHRGWCIRHNNDEPAKGLFPMVMDTLFARRSGLKKTRLFPLESEIEATTTMLAAAAKARADARAANAANATADASADASAVTATDEAAEAADEAAEAPLSAAELYAAAGDDKEARHVVDAAVESAGADAAAGAVYAALQKRLTAAKFEFAAVDSKQKALKIYMNTFYGCTGNKGDLDRNGKRLPDGTPIDCTNPLFMLEFAAAVTSGGQYNIKLVAQLVEAEGWIVTYGDTDSVYVKGPDRIFAAADARYAAALAAIEAAHPADADSAARAAYEKQRLDAKEAYWTEMVEITMREVGALRDDVNAKLRADNGTGKLRVAYEEVLFPTVLCGKKKYAGLAHIERVNFRPKKYFVRGIDAVVKIGQAPLVRDISDAIIWRILALDETRTPQEIAEAEFARACRRDWPPEYFIRTATYKPDKQNPSVLRFVDRMRERLAAERASIAAERRRYAQEHGVPLEEAPERAPLNRVPEAGDRFEFVICEAEAAYDLRGLKLSLKAGDLMEFPDVAAALGKKPDMVYYLTQYVAGQCGRFLNYAFDPEESFAPGDEKKRDEESQKRAKSHLVRKLKADLGIALRSKAQSKAYKRAYKQTAAELWRGGEDAADGDVRPLWVRDPDGLVAAARDATAGALVTRIEDMARAVAEATPYDVWAGQRVKAADAELFAQLRAFYCGRPRRVPASAVFRVWEKHVTAARQGLIQAAPDFQIVQGAHSRRLAEAVIAARAQAHAEDPALGGAVERPPELSAPLAADLAAAYSSDATGMAQRAADAAFARYVACLEVLRHLHVTQTAVRERAQKEAGGRMPHVAPAGFSPDAALRSHAVVDLGPAAFPLSP